MTIPAVTLKKYSQIGFELETTEGTPETLTAADYSLNRRNHSHSDKRPGVDRGLTRATNTPAGVLKGPTLTEISWAEEMVGGAASMSTVAPWHKLLRAMGFVGAQLKSITIGSRTGGEYAIGNTIGNNTVQGSATKTGIVLAVLATRLVYLPVTGTFADTDTIYNYATSQVSSTQSGAASDSGVVFTPLTQTESVPNECGTTERRRGGEKIQITGSRGSGGISFKHGEAPILKVTMQGLPIIDATTKRPATASAITGIPVVGATPLATKHGTMKMAGNTLVLTMFDIDFGNVLSPRKTISDVDIASSGYCGVLISDRKPVIKFDPEFLISSANDVAGLMTTGATFDLVCTAGLTTHTNGMIVAWAPAAQIADDVSEGDRDGITTQDITAVLTGEPDKELYIAHVF